MWVAYVQFEQALGSVGACYLRTGGLGLHHLFFSNFEFSIGQENMISFPIVKLFELKH